MDVRGKPASIKQQHDLAATGSSRWVMALSRLGLKPWETFVRDGGRGQQVDEVDVRQRPIAGRAVR